MSMDEYLHEMPQDWKNRASKSIGFYFAEDILLFLIFYPANVMILQITNHSAAAYLWPLILLAAMLASTLNRKKSNRMILFFPLQLAIAVLMTIAAPDLAGRFLFGTESFIITVYAFYTYMQDIKLQNKYKEDPYGMSQALYFGTGMLCFGTVALYITFLTALGFHLGTNQTVTLLCYCCMLIVYEVYQHWSGTRTLMQDYKPTEAFALRRLSRIFTVCAIFIIPIVAAITETIYLYSGLENVDYALIRLLSGGYLNPHATMPQHTDQKQSSSPMEAIQRLAGKPSKPNPIIECILNIIFILLAAAVVLLLVIIIIKKLRGFFALQKNPDEIHHSVFSLKESAVAIRSGVMRRRPFHAVFSGRPNNIRVRKTFRRFVMKDGAAPQKGKTPTELMRRLDSTSDTQQAAQIYEKARYSDSECTQEEVARFKKLTKK